MISVVTQGVIGTAWLPPPCQIGRAKSLLHSGFASKFFDMLHDVCANRSKWYESKISLQTKSCQYTTLGVKIDLGRIHALVKVDADNSFGVVQEALIDVRCKYQCMSVMSLM